MAEWIWGHTRSNWYLQFLMQGVLFMWIIQNPGDGNSWTNAVSQLADALIEAKCTILRQRNMGSKGHL